MTYSISKRDDACWTRRDVARFLKCSPRHVDRLRERGQLPYFYLGKSVRFRPSDVVALTEPNGSSDRDLAAYVARVVADAPQLTAAQRDRLAELLRPVRKGGAA